MLRLCFLSRHFEEGVLDDSPPDGLCGMARDHAHTACRREPGCQGQVWAGTSTATWAPRRGAALARNRHPLRNLPATEEAPFSMCTEVPWVPAAALLCPAFLRSRVRNSSRLVRECWWPRGSFLSGAAQAGQKKRGFMKFPYRFEPALGNGSLCRLFCCARVSIVQIS